MPDPKRYQTIAVASAFSPRFEHVLAEAKRIRDRFGAALSLIYVGEESATTKQKFSEALQRQELPLDSAIFYEQGDPAEAILRAAEKNSVELLVAGALEKEVVLHPFLGHVARRILRDGRGSVILFTKPAAQPERLRTIIFVAEYSEHGTDALRRVLHLASEEKSERLYVIRLITTFDDARARRKNRKGADPEAELEQFVLSIGQTDVPTEVRCIRGNTGLAVADFVESVKSDLLVVPSLPGAQLPPNLGWLLDVIPCNLWVIR